MKKIHLLLIRSFLGPFLMSFSILLFLLVVQLVASYLKEISGRGIGMDLLGNLFFYGCLRVSALSAPIAVLAAGLMTFGALGENNELAAIKSSGISLWKMIMPLIVFFMFVTAIVLADTFYAIPWTNLKFYNLIYDIKRKKPDLAIKPGYFYGDIDGYVIRVSDNDPEKRLLYDIQIYNHTLGRGNTDIIMADSARMALVDSGRVMQMILYHGTRHEEYPPENGHLERYPYGRTYFDSLYYKFRLSGFDLNRTEERSFRHQITLPYNELATTVDSIRKEQLSSVVKNIEQMSRFTKIDSQTVKEKTSLNIDAFKFEAVNLIKLEPGDSLIDCIPDSSRSQVLNTALSNARGVQGYMEFLDRSRQNQLEQLAQYEYEYYQRWALPFSIIVFLFIGVSLGSIIRKGGLGMPSLISVVFFIVYYIVITYSKKMVKEMEIPPLPAAWMPVLIMAPLAVVSFYLALNDANVTTLTGWTSYIGKGFRYLKQKLKSSKKQKQ